MDTLINTALVPVVFLARLWVQWMALTFVGALVFHGLAMIVNRPKNPAFRLWWNYGVLGPHRLALSLLGSKPKKKRRGH